MKEHSKIIYTGTEQHLMSLHNAGLSDGKIAKIMNLSKSVIRNKRYKLGLISNGKMCNPKYKKLNSKEMKIRNYQNKIIKYKGQIRWLQKQIQELNLNLNKIGE